MKHCLLLILVILLVGAALSLSASEMPDTESLERLSGGEILLLESFTEESKTSVHVQALAHVSAKSVWDIIFSCDYANVFVLGLKVCEVLENTGDRALIRQVVKRSWTAPIQHFTYESLREPYRETRFKLVEGSLKAMEGSWRFTEIPEGLLLDYRLRVQPEISVPGFILNNIISKDSLNLMACIRGLAAGSGSEKQSKSDLGRCPGERQAGQ